MAVNFTPAETKTLTYLLSEHLDADWQTIADMLGTGRSADACRKHASARKMRDRHGRARPESRRPPVVEQSLPLPLELPPTPVPVPVPAPASAPRTDAERVIADLLAVERIRARKELIDQITGLLLRLKVED